jgi:hypothetical protein
MASTAGRNGRAIGKRAGRPISLAGIRTRSPVESIVIGAIAEGVIAGPTEQTVVPGVAVQCVVAIVPIERILPLAPRQSVVSFAARHLVIPIFTEEPIFHSRR